MTNTLTPYADWIADMQSREKINPVDDRFNTHVVTYSLTSAGFRIVQDGGIIG